MILRACTYLIAIAAWMLRRVHLKQPAAAILFIFLFPQLVYCAAIRIMPLGDSITAGFGSGLEGDPANSSYFIAYRKVLRDSLVSAGYEIDYVGSLTSGEALFADAQHEGHGGWRADMIVSEIYGWLQANPADVILLHIGTNDLNTNNNDTSATDVKNILDEIDRYEENFGVAITVVLARIINTSNHICPNGSYTTDFNNNVEDMALDRVNNAANPAYPDKIIMVNMECGAGLDYGVDATAPYTHDMYDFLHPNPSGYERMADVWFEGLLNILPLADPGPDQDVNPGEVVTLDGTCSDSLGTIVSCSWTQTDGTHVTLINATTAEASFTAPDTHTGATLTFELTITDDKGFTHSDSCVVSVNGAPTADAGPDQRVKAGTSVVLDGSNSNDADGGIVDYEWVQTSGIPVGALANAGTSKASFSAPPVGSGGSALTFRLTVTDDKGAARSDTCVVNVNGPPVADAGTDQIANPDAPVVLDGSKSEDADGSIVSYQWVQTAGLPVGDLVNANTSQAGFTAPAVGSGGAILSFRLTVTDDLGVQSSDTVDVQINGPPTADAGPNQQVQSGANVTLDGSGSTDGGNGALVYAWIQTSGPAVALSDPTSLRPSFQAPSVGSTAITLSFWLTVTDNGGLQSEDSCTVTVTPPGESSQSGSGGGGGGGGCFITAAGQ